MADLITVSAPPLDRDTAVLLIEQMETRGVPPSSIEMNEHLARGTDSERAGRHFGSLGMKVLGGGAIGALLGAVVGALLGWFTSIDLGLALVSAAAFGAFAGIAFGGMLVARFASPAWRDAGSTTTPTLVRVSVHNADRSIVATAMEVIQDQGLEAEL